MSEDLLSDQKVRRDFIPPSDYSPEFHRLEMERLWPRVWQPACREEEIPEVGDYVNYEIGQDSILPPFEARRNDTYLRAAYGDPEARGPWAQAVISSLGLDVSNTSRRVGVDTLGRLATGSLVVDSLTIPDSSVSRRQLVLARDRLGKKPLYYQANSRQVLFGSELKALAACESFQREISPGAGIAPAVSFTATSGSG